MKSVFAFWLELLRSPREVGAITPSGQALCTAIIKVLMAEKPGCVVELGAGTGVITRALEKNRNEFLDLIVIEKSTKLVGLLLRRYPHLKIIAGCASLVGSIDFPSDQPLTIISSLPLRSLPVDELNTIREVFSEISRKNPSFRLIQYSYFGRVPFVTHVDWFAWEKMETVFRNIPPATVWQLRVADMKGVV